MMNNKIIFKHLCLALSLLTGLLMVLSSGAYASEMSEGKTELIKTCNLYYMADTYGVNVDGTESDPKYCWFCNVVIIMTKAYLEAAAKTAPVTQSLGHLIVKYGFAIWTALFILKHLTTMSGTTPGKMLQELLMMGFKCCFAYYAISNGTPFFTEYILEPIMMTGLDVGFAILDGLTENITFDMSSVVPPQPTSL